MGKSKRKPAAEPEAPEGDATEVPPAEGLSAEAPADATAPADPLAAAEAQAAEYLNLLQTVQAEYLNYRKRVKQEKDDVRLAEARGWAAALLPVLDQLHMAAGAAGDADTIRQGVQMILHGFEQALAHLGVQPIATDGERFDPDRHEAVGMVPSSDVDAGTIVNEVQRGFSFQGRVLRAPRVLVAATPPPAPADGESEA